MKPVERSEILSLGAYEEIRDRFRARIIAEKKNRRLAVGANMTALFENHDTVLYQIQEMLRTERITSESGIAHEIETYNTLVPAADELCMTLLVEYPEKEERDRMLVELAGLEETVYVSVGGTRVLGAAEARSDDHSRTTAVHYLKFALGRELTQALQRGAPASVGVDHPKYRVETPLGKETRASLVADLTA